MKISKKITKSLGKLIAGDTGIAPYMSGPELVEFLMNMILMMNMVKDSHPDGFILQIKLPKVMVR